jgi:hypothetical protein
MGRHLRTLAENDIVIRRYADVGLDDKGIPSTTKGVGVIYEMRTYQVQAGKAGEFLKMYQAQGLPLISRYAKLIGCWIKESGVLNSVVFLWAYEDLGHRTGQRAKMAQDPEWTAFVPSMLPYLVHQESVFLSPAAFSPLQ